MNFSTGCDDAVREAITQSGINNGASTHICVRKTDIDEEILDDEKISLYEPNKVPLVHGYEDISNDENITYNKRNVLIQMGDSEDISDEEYFAYNERNVILQVDGNEDLSEDEEDIPTPSNLYTINYEDQKIYTWINFFRGFDFIWENTSSHCMCNLRKLDKGLKNCFFCVMRSACLRLSNRGKSGPKGLKPYMKLFHKWASSMYLN